MAHIYTLPSFSANPFVFGSDVVTMPAPPARHRPRSPSSSFDPPPPMRRRLFSRPLQPPLIPAPPPPRRTLSFKMNDNISSNSSTPAPASSCHSFSFKMSSNSVLNPGDFTCTFAFSSIGYLYILKWVFVLPTKLCATLGTTKKTNDLQVLEKMTYKTTTSKHFCWMDFNGLTDGRMSFRIGMRGKVSLRCVYFSRLRDD